MACGTSACTVARIDLTTALPAELPRSRVTASRPHEPCGNTESGRLTPPVCDAPHSVDGPCGHNLMGVRDCAAEA